MDVIYAICFSIIVLYVIGFVAIIFLYENPPLALESWIFRYTRGGLVLSALASGVISLHYIWSHVR
jgi:hypothetical protein